MSRYYFDITANSYKMEEYSATNFRLKGMSGSRPIYRQFVFDITLNFRVHVGNRRWEPEWFFFFEHTRVYASKRFATVRLRFSRDPLGFFSSTGWLTPVTLTRPTGFVLISFDESPWRWEKIVNTFAIRRMPAFDILATNYTTRIAANRVVSSHLLSLPIEFFFFFYSNVKKKLASFYASFVIIFLSKNNT